MSSQNKQIYKGKFFPFIDNNSFSCGQSHGEKSPPGSRRRSRTKANKEREKRQAEKVKKKEKERRKKGEARAKKSKEGKEKKISKKKYRCKADGCSQAWPSGILHDDICLWCEGCGLYGLCFFHIRKEELLILLCNHESS
jgi:hypothetical protein